ncbi:MAG: tetratricopeptide repeat protein [Gammaproteobacteria bacterium]|nr:tetratricopeptide repeat protein [Gammaproteobacteria bacterium]
MKYRRQAIPLRQVPRRVENRAPEKGAPDMSYSSDTWTSDSAIDDIGNDRMDGITDAWIDKHPGNRTDNPREVPLFTSEPLRTPLAIFEFVSKHWPLVLSLLLLFFMVMAGLLTDISFSYPFEKIKQGQLQLEHERVRFDQETREYENAQNQRKIKHRMAARQRELGKALLDSGLYQDAEAAFQTALDLDDSDWRATLGHFKAQALRLAANNEHDPAVIDRRLRMMLKENPEDPHAHTMLGELLAEADPEAAEAHYRRALVAESRAAHARFGLAGMLAGRGDYEAARPLLEEAVLLVPQRPLYLTNLAHVLAKIGDFPTAVEHYRRALALDGERILGYFELAGALRMARKLEDAHANHRMGAALLARKQVADLPKNQTSWHFQVSPGHAEDFDGMPSYTVYLDRHEQKRLYGYLALAASEFLLGREEEARRQMQDLPQLPVREHQEIEWLVSQELQALVKNQQYLAGTVEAFLKLLE